MLVLWCKRGAGVNDMLLLPRLPHLPHLLLLLLLLLLRLLLLLLTAR
jgi:hypothetical protein